MDIGMNDINALYTLWREKAVLDPDLKAELDAVAGQEDEVLDRFYRNLAFGTAGLRGVIGAGTNRMNLYTVNQATQGLADFLNARYAAPQVAIAYDSRIKSDLFAREAAGVLAANGIVVHFFRELVPTPMLSFAVRRLRCQSGIIITASHNPAKYNGYKCYDPEGYQMTDEAAEETYRCIQKVDLFEGIKRMDFDYWEITNPYDEIATVNTENMYEMFGVLVNFDLSNGIDTTDTDTGLDDTQTYFTVDFVNTVNDDTAREKEDADATATILIGNTDENGDYYATVKGYEDAVYLLSKESVNSLLELKPFNLILKIPALVNIDTLESADMTVGKKTYTMKLDGEKYKFNKKSVKKEKFTELYQALQSVMLDSEIGETKSAEEKEEVLSVTFHRNTEEAPEITLKYYTYDDIYDSLEINGTERFLVKAEDVDALVKQIKKAF